MIFEGTEKQFLYGNLDKIKDKKSDSNVWQNIT